MKYAALIFIFALVFSSCKKVKPVNMLCDGNGSQSYFPLAVGNSWHYGTGEVDSIASFWDWDSVYIFTITGNPTDTIRVAPNGDIYIKAPGYVENLYLPAQLNLGTTWAGDYPAQNIKDTSTVVDMNAIITTGSCVYTGCVKIETVWHYPAHTQTDTRFHKKGIGEVYRTYNSGSSISTLTGVKLN